MYKSLNPTSLAWNFFQRDAEPDLWCAVTAYDSLPGFLLSGEWRFSGHGSGHQDEPPGFNAGVAAQFQGLNGFYLFQAIPSAAI